VKWASGNREGGDADMARAAVLNADHPEVCAGVLLALLQVARCALTAVYLIAERMLINSAMLLDSIATATCTRTTCANCRTVQLALRRFVHPRVPFHL
jgi:hypothetical protein